MKCQNISQIEVIKEFWKQICQNGGGGGGEENHIFNLMSWWNVSKQSFGHWNIKITLSDFSQKVKVLTKLQFWQDTFSKRETKDEREDRCFVFL